MPVFAVTTARGPRWDSSRDTRAQAGWDQQAAFMDDLVDRRIVILGGPIDGEPGEVALLAMEADGPGHVRSIFDADPWVVSGLLRVADIRAWTLWLDSRPDRSPRGPDPGTRFLPEPGLGRLAG